MLKGIIRPLLAKNCSLLIPIENTHDFTNTVERAYRTGLNSTVTFKWFEGPIVKFDIHQRNKGAFWHPEVEQEKKKYKKII